MTILDQTNTIDAPAVVEQPQVVKPKAAKANGKVKSTSPAVKRIAIAEGETRKRILEVVPDTKIVRATYTFKIDNKSTDDYPVESMLDFSDCTDEEILILAAKSVRIDVQAKLRALGQSAIDDATVMSVVNVKTDVLNSVRLPVDETLRTIRQLARGTGMSEAAARAIVESELAKRTK